MIFRNGTEYDSELFLWIVYVSDTIFRGDVWMEEIGGFLVNGYLYENVNPPGAIKHTVIV